jgi:hypothetical protein
VGRRCASGAGRPGEQLAGPGTGGHGESPRRATWSAGSCAGDDPGAQSGRPATVGPVGGAWRRCPPDRGVASAAYSARRLAACAARGRLQMRKRRAHFATELQKNLRRTGPEPRDTSGAWRGAGGGGTGGRFLRPAICGGKRGRRRGRADRAPGRCRTGRGSPGVTPSPTPVRLRATRGSGKTPVSIGSRWFLEVLPEL